MPDIDGWIIQTAPGGWVQAYNTASDSTAYLRLQTDDGGRLTTYLSLMDGRSPVSTRVWREFPFAKIEQVLTGHPHMTASGSAPDAVDVLRTYFATRGENAEVAPRQGCPEPPLLRRPGHRITDEFLRDLAATYRWLVSAGSSAPAIAIARQTGAPAATVHRWITNARKRGFLPTGRPGRVG